MSYADTFFISTFTQNQIIRIIRLNEMKCLIYFYEFDMTVFLTQNDRNVIWHTL